MSKDMHTVPLSGIPYRFSLQRRKNQKHINLKVTHGGRLFVSAPVRASMDRIHAAIAQKQRWIDRHMGKATDRASDMDPLKCVLIDGHSYTVIVHQDPERRRVIRLDHGARTLTLRTNATEISDQLEILSRWYRRQARNVLGERAAHFSATTRVPIRTVYIRDQKTRWGSSSTKGNISLNWRTLMAPKYVQDYLILHELAHQRHMNHSSRFWDTVERWTPDREDATTWLRENSFLLGLFRE